MFWSINVKLKLLRENIADWRQNHRFVRKRQKWTGDWSHPCLGLKADAIPKTATRWTPRGTEQRGHPLENWRTRFENGMNINKMVTGADGKIGI